MVREELIDSLRGMIKDVGTISVDYDAYTRQGKLSLTMRLHEEEVGKVGVVIDEENKRKKNHSK